MAQSSNYKQYGRSTRILTEESGFSGGILWTDNNQDESHLKTLVNLDYDDTTGCLKTRDPFVPMEEVDLSEVLKNTGVNLKNTSLLGTHNLCATHKDDPDNLTEAGQLYIFAQSTAYDNVWETPFNQQTVVALFKDVSEDWYLCELVGLGTDDVLRNTVVKHTLLLHDNLLYGIGYSATSEAWLYVYQLQVTDTDGVVKYSFVQIARTVIDKRIKDVTLLEACVTGFNAARGKDAFTYTAEKVTSNPRILGYYITDEQGNIVVGPNAGHDMTIHVQTAYLAGVSTLALFEYKEGSNSTNSVEDVWNHVLTCTSENGHFTLPYTFSKKETTFALTFFSTNPVEEKDITVYSEKAVDYHAPWVVTVNDTAANLKLKTYDFTQMDGSCIWNNRMCIWGTNSNNNCLFLSEVDNFYYYPIPNNVAVFDTNVISCIPYKNTLLVFTANRIYRLSISNDGSLIQDVVQNDMPLSKTDSAHLTAIKNMVLFKSGNYFYMLVPKTQSLSDELSIAPIYKNIAGFLNTLDNSVPNMLQLLYPECLFTDCTIGYNPSAVYSEQDSVFIVYNINATVQYAQYDKIETTPCFFKLFLNYNTNLRAWTMYIEDTTQQTLDVSCLTKARNMSFVRVTGAHTFNIVCQQHSVDTKHSMRVLLDTGYRTLSSSMQKRFREIQLKLYSETENITAFGTAFLIDGSFRRSYTTLQEFVTDGVVNLIPELDLNTFVTELSMPVSEDGSVVKEPGSDSIELSDWNLDFSHFKRGAPITVRVPVSGKGFNPRFILMIPNALNIHINDVNWVYRIMHGR